MALTKVKLIADDAITSAMIDSTSTGVAFADLTVDTNTLVVDAVNNRVGIGTNSPSYPLEVQSGGVGTVLRAGTSFISIDPTGSAAAPSLIFNGDSNTGIYRPTTDTLGFSTAGSERMRIDSNGRVGIGKTSANEKLEVSGALSIEGALVDHKTNATTLHYFSNSGYLRAYGSSAGTGQLIFETGGGGGSTTTERMRITSDGKIQAQTSGGYYLTESTTNAFSITSNGANGHFKIRDEYNSADRILIDSSGNVGINDTNPNTANLSIKGQSTGVSANYPMLKLLGQNTSSDGLHITTTGTGNNYYAIKVATGADSNAFNVTNAGRVGIGANAPGSKLEVRQEDDTFNDLDLLTLKRVWSTASGSDRAHGIKFSDNNATLANIYADRTNSGSNYNSDLVFITNSGSTGTSTSERMRIDSSGNVIVGGTSYNGVTGETGFEIYGDTAQFLLNNPTYNHFTIYSAGDSNIYNVFGNSGNYLIGTGGKDTSSWSEKMRITSGGNVGIGETSPAEALTVVGTIRVQSASGDTDGLHISSDSSGDALINAGYSVSDLKFATADLERMRIAAGGYVGIANNNPASLLSVGSTSYGSTARIDCMAADSQNAEIRAFGNAQGTGVVYVGQSTVYGGGIAYNGDGSPAYGDFGTDRVTLFARHGGTSHKVADWSYANTDKSFNFYGPIVVSGTRGTAGQVLTSNGNAQASWETPSGGAWGTATFDISTVTTSGTTVATTVNASTVSDKVCGIVRVTFAHANRIAYAHFTIYETSNVWFFTRVVVEDGNSDLDIFASGNATNTITIKVSSSSPSSGYDGKVVVEAYPASMFGL